MRSEDAGQNEANDARRLGRYSLVAEIARGGMGVIYLAQATTKAGFWAKKLVVIKHLKPEHSEDENLREMFLDEARLAARLHHRNIVSTIEVVEEQQEDEAAIAAAPPGLGPRHFFVMEYLEGRTLKSALTRLKGSKALSVPMILRITCQVLAGLHYAHELTDEDGGPLRVVHRDVSAHNVFLTYDGQVKLLDFGVAKAFGRIHETDAGVLKGRVDCMSPEYLGDEPVDRRADVFAVGVLLREALTGRRVWEGMSEVEILKELLAKRVPALPSDGVSAELPREIREVMEKAMAPAVEDRFRTAHAMRATIEQYVARLDPAAKALGQMGDTLTKAFADHRNRVRELVDQHESGVTRGIATGLELPSFPLSVMEMPAVSLSSPPSAAAPSSSSSVPAAPLSSSAPPAYGGASSATPTPPPATASSVPLLPIAEMADEIELPKASSVVPRSVVAVAASTPPTKPAKSGRSGAILGGVFAVAMVAAGVALYLKAASTTATRTTASMAGSSSSSAAAPPPPVSSLVVAPAAASAAESGEPVLTIHASPDFAQIFVDDAVGKNPFSAKLSRGEHTIRVIAPGHLPKTEVVNLIDPMSMTVALERPEPGVANANAAPPPPVAAARPGFRNPTPPPRGNTGAKPETTPPPAPPALPAGTDVFGGGTAPKRTIDSKTPYE